MKHCLLVLLGIILGISGCYATKSIILNFDSKYNGDIRVADTSEERLDSDKTKHTMKVSGGRGVMPPPNSNTNLRHSMDMHKHPLRNISENTPQPSVNHLVFPDMMDGYNIQIMTTNFRITPAAINMNVKSNTGHAHLYVNGEKYARIYGNWYHLPSSALNKGVNMVSVTLNANDHSEWAVDNTPIKSTVRVVKR